MNKIILTRGIQGSGKSSWAKSWVKEDPEHRVRWNNDDVRNMFGEYWVPSRENTKALDIMKGAFISRFMSCGYDIVIDDMNLNPKTAKAINDIVYQQNKLLGTNYEIEFKDFFTPVDECIKRDSFREHPIGEKVIKQTWRKYRSFIINQLNKQYAKQFTKAFDYTKENAIIVDLDGTVACNLQDRPYFGDGCAEEIHNDTPITPTIHIVENFFGHVIFLTGRDESCREETIKWIESNIDINHLDYDLYMREPNDYTSGVEFKTKIYKENIEPYYNVEFVLEDSTKVVEAFRALDLFVLQPCNSFY